MRLLAVCVLGAAVSLLLPSEPSFDPWAWIVWGREVASLDLNTAGGPSWKPLPVVFTTIFAPLASIDGSLPAALWLVVARAGALLALAMAFLLARRLAGPSRWTGIGAGLLAVAGLALTPQWLRNAAHGNEVPLAVGLLLLGINHHLDEKRSSALALGFLACLLRPEVFPFLAAYGVWMWRAVPERRALVGGLAIALPVLWLVPEWIGSGDPLGAGTQARGEPVWSLSLRERPWLAALERAHGLAGLPLELGAVTAAVLAARRRTGVDRVTLALFAVAVSWLVLVVVMVESGFSGSPRYFTPAVVLVCVLAGVGAARLVQVMPHPATAAALALLLAVAAVPWATDHGRRFEAQVVEAGRLAGQHRDLVATLQRLGGEEAVKAQGVPRIKPTHFATRMAWEVDAPIGDIEYSPGRGLVFFADVPTPRRRSLAPEVLRGTRRMEGDWYVRMPQAPQDVKLSHRLLTPR